MNPQPRVITGTAKGTRLLVPSSARPITDRIRMSVFDLLGDRIKNSKVLDLYAGAGTMGIEALSRGAEHCIFVDNSHDAQLIIQRNLANSKLETNARIFNQSVNSFCAAMAPLEKSKFEIVFLDPPFEDAHKLKWEAILPLIKAGGIGVCRLPNINYPSPETLAQAGLVSLYVQEYGESKVLFVAPA